MMPYLYTAKDSLTDAELCATALGVRYDNLPIANAKAGLDAMLASQTSDGHWVWPMKTYNPEYEGWP